MAGDFYSLWVFLDCCFFDTLTLFPLVCRNNSAWCRKDPTEWASYHMYQLDTCRQYCLRLFRTKTSGRKISLSLVMLTYLSAAALLKGQNILEVSFQLGHSTFHWAHSNVSAKDDPPQCCVEYTPCLNMLNIWLTSRKTVTLQLHSLNVCTVCNLSTELCWTSASFTKSACLMLWWQIFLIPYF